VKAPAPSFSAGLVVSNSLVTGTSASRENASSLITARVAYVSAKPGSSAGNLVSVRNQTHAGSPVVAPIINGGFDPLAVEAEPGDDLLLTISFVGDSQVSTTVKVPARRPPGIVRTEPSKGRVDVALNIQIAVVFSEPVDRASVTSSSLVLMQGGNRVSGQVQIAPDALSAEFIPDSQLEPATAYSLVVDGGIRDLDGDLLGETSIVEFETAGNTTAAQLVFTREIDRQIYTTGLDGNGFTQLTTAGGNSRPVFSPDGSRIAFSRYDSHDPIGSAADIYTMNSDGSGVTRLTVNADLSSAAWSPDGRKLLVSDEDVYDATLFVIDLDEPGSAPKFLAYDARTPAWSPDGQKIAFIRTSGDDGYHQIFIMNPDGTHQKPLTIQDPGGIYGLSWSPDGKRLAFSKCLDFYCAIYTMNADGSDWNIVTQTTSAGGAEWSPDGKWIAFTINNYAEGGWVWLPSIAYVSAEGGPVHVVRDGFWPSWRR
jgi:hypothetical protein